jgi:DNA-binding NtrC family response regulator
MFGHVKGAFTDAKDNRTGRFENASGGTIFLDEIGNLSISLQAKLLSVLETRKITPVGSNKIIPIDIRLVSATNKDLNNLVKDDLFREDLFYRLNTVQIELPPLRERGEDIILLADYFLKEYTFKYEKPGLKFNASSIENLMTYRWPGNIRELKHTIEKAVILCESDIIKPDDLSLNRMTGTGTNLPSVSIEDAEKKVIIIALNKNKWNISETAKELNIGRQTLYRKIQKYDLQ